MAAEDMVEGVAFTAAAGKGAPSEWAAAARRATEARAQAASMEGTASERRRRSTYGAVRLLAAAVRLPDAATWFGAPGKGELDLG
jgi:hypothetical protein